MENLKTYKFDCILIGNVGHEFDSWETTSTDFKACFQKVKEWALGRGSKYGLNIRCDELQKDYMYTIWSNGAIKCEGVADTETGHITYFS